MPRSINRVTRSTVFGVVLLALSYSSIAACPERTYRTCFLNQCTCLPEIGGSVGQAAEQAKREFIAQTEGPALAAWIIESRNTAIGTSAPMPAQIRTILTGFIDEDILNRVRFKVGDNGALNLARLAFVYGDKLYGNDVVAVTLDDVIVFANLSDAYNNGTLWAHELAHVAQFKNWGIQAFAIKYARNAGGVENEAIAQANRYGPWRMAQNGGVPPGFTPAPSGPPGFQPPSGFVPSGPPPGFQRAVGLPSGSTMLACGCYGPNALPVAVEPRCANQTAVLTPCNASCPASGQQYGYVCQ
jgi:Domain of unknown function (DUF4157)